MSAGRTNAVNIATYANVTLPNTGWSNSKRTISVEGVLGDATKQLVVPCPQNETAIDAWYEAGVKIVSQSTDSLTFKCDSTPSVSIPLYIALIPIGG